MYVTENDCVAFVRSGLSQVVPNNLVIWKTLVKILRGLPNKAAPTPR